MASGCQRALGSRRRATPARSPTRGGPTRPVGDRRSDRPRPIGLRAVPAVTRCRGTASARTGWARHVDVRRRPHRWLPPAQRRGRHPRSEADASSCCVRRRRRSAHRPFSSSAPCSPDVSPSSWCSTTFMARQPRCRRRRDGPRRRGAGRVEHRAGRPYGRSVAARAAALSMDFDGRTGVTGTVATSLVTTGLVLLVSAPARRLVRRQSGVSRSFSTLLR